MNKAGIVGNEIAKELRDSDGLPPFDMIIAKNSIKAEIGKEKFGLIKDLSEPVAATSMLQLDLLKIEEKVIN